MSDLAAIRAKLTERASGYAEDTGIPSAYRDALSIAEKHFARAALSAPQEEGEGFTDWERATIHDFARRSLDALSAPEAGSELGQRWLALLNKTRDRKEAGDAR